MSYIKESQSHPQAAAVEAAGLRWLKAAESVGGPAVVDVLESRADSLHLERVTPQKPSASDAAEFGAALARMHQSVGHEDPRRHYRDSPTLFGTLPPDHPVGVPHLFGPADQLLELGAEQHESWGAFYAAERLDPVLRQLAGRLTSAETQLLQGAQERISAGDFDTGEPASLVHGDLWSGNVLWSSHGAVLIDPAAHAGHRETDLAMLQLFGMPHLDEVLSAYQQAAPLAEGWQDRVPVHQLFYLAVHLLLFGPTYHEATIAAAEHATRLRG